MTHCNVAANRTIPCDGDYMKSEGCCLRHAVLFDYWIAEHSGFRVYNFRREGETPQIRRWKRAKFHTWLNTLTIEDVERIMCS